MPGFSYPYCAVCGASREDRTSSGGFVCTHCYRASSDPRFLDERPPDTTVTQWRESIAGEFLYAYCAWCGGWLFEDHRRSRRYVHELCRSGRRQQRPTAEPVPPSVCPRCFQIRSAAGTCGCE